MTQIINRGTTVIFVSHNLSAICDLCSRALLLERGKAVAIGKTEEVISVYLKRNNDDRKFQKDREMFISRVAIRGNDGPKNHFRSGERAFIDIEAVSRSDLEKIAFVVVISNESVLILNTSSEMLGLESITIQRDQKKCCTFSIDLHLVGGTYYVSALLLRYDINKEYDQWLAAETFFVSAESGIRGIANLYPTVALQQ